VNEQFISAMAYSKELPNVLVTIEESQNIFRKEECFKIVSKNFEVDENKRKITHSLPLILSVKFTLLRPQSHQVTGCCQCVHKNFSPLCYSDAEL
jgi:hypothetical protein